MSLCDESSYHATSVVRESDLVIFRTGHISTGFVGVWLIEIVEFHQSIPLGMPSKKACWKVRLFYLKF